MHTSIRLHRGLIAFTACMLSYGWGKCEDPKSFLSKERQLAFGKHALVAYNATRKAEKAFELPIQEDRVLQHLGKRGFPWLVHLLDDLRLSVDAMALFKPEDEMKSWSLDEEQAAYYLVDTSMEVVLTAQRSACFYLLKEVAPAPEAMKVENEAKQLETRFLKEQSESKALTTEMFFEHIRGIRALFDRLKDLPKLSPAEFAEERAHSAVLSPAEYIQPMLDHDGRGEPQWRWHRKWDHTGYILAFSELDTVGFAGPQLVVNKDGGIFEWYDPGVVSLNAPHPPYECMLQAADFEELKRSLRSLPPSHKRSKKNRFIISFQSKGRWATRVFDSLPAGNPFETLVSRMIAQSRWREGPGEPKDEEFLMATPQ